ncbi:MAG: right-handed parallel beta-helix repeat-containing protein [Candidatus Bathyarchaeota archaeon]|nr:right-handed parallel beta-helix repeat-containing protein [Candidatus Bathyarchaeota archaeon]MDT8782532.1 right-handed parallel beta-helix repeat-containing protein [Candidatus Bathyarchaeota archaeon]
MLTKTLLTLNKPNPNRIAMQKTTTLLLIIALTAPLITLNQPVQAQQNTITVPEDHPTITQAIQNANNNDIIYIKSGTYPEHTITINKTITLIGENPSNTTIKNIDKTPEWDQNIYYYPPSPPYAIKVESSGVKISGLTITGTDSRYQPLGIFADHTQIENNIIKEGSEITVSSSNNTIKENKIDNGKIRLLGSYNNFLHNNVIATSGNQGVIHVQGTYNLVFGNNLKNIYGFATGIKLFGGGEHNNIVAKNNLTGCEGIEINGCSDTVVFGNRLLNSGSIQLTSGYNNTFFGNHIENGYYAISIGANEEYFDNNVFYHNNFVNNTHQISTYSSAYGRVSFDNGRVGNYWSVYNGSDGNGDGIGDTPYIIFEEDSADFHRETKDNFPLIAPFDLSTLDVELTQWTKIEVNQPGSELSPMVPLAVVAVTVLVVATVLLVYFKKRPLKLGGKT